MSNIREHLLAEVKAGAISVTFTLKELEEKFCKGDFWLIDGKKYDSKTVKTLFSNHSIGPGSRRGESVKRGGVALFYKSGERGVYSILTEENKEIISNKKSIDSFENRSGKNSNNSSNDHLNLLKPSKSVLMLNPLIVKFVSKLSHLIADKAPFKHTFDVKDKAWIKAQGGEWFCNSLVHAKQQYWWNGDYKANDKQLNALSKGLKESIKTNDEVSALYYSLRTLEWGEVYRGAVKFLLDSFDSKCIVEKLKAGQQILDGNDYSIESFESGYLRMDSGMTKIYSLICEASIIMDSRVAAAMTLIADRTFSEKEKEELAKLNVFASGTSATSDKKRRTIKNKKVFSHLLKPSNQAHHNLITNWLIQEAISQAEEIEPSLYRLCESPLVS